MFLDWTKNLQDPKDKTEFEQAVYRSKDVLERLIQLISEYEDSISRSETEMSSFDQPNWDYRQAFKNGQRACLNKIKNLINLDDQ